MPVSEGYLTYVLDQLRPIVPGIDAALQRVADECTGLSRAGLPWLVRA